MNNQQSKLSIHDWLKDTNLPYKFYFFDSVASTNDTAKEIISKNGAADSIITADTQSAGRGRNGRAFHSPRGGIYMSFIFSHESISFSPVFQLFSPCVAVCVAMEELLNIKPRIKWPNDILLNGKKVCGILTETRLSHGGSASIIGIGINYAVNPDSLPEDIIKTSGTLLEYTENIPIGRFSAYLINKMDELNSRWSKERYLSEYKSRTDLLGGYINVISSKGSFKAKAIDVCDDGSLIIERENEGVEKIYAGEVSIRKNRK